jgi:hypothetical protein
MGNVELVIISPECKSISSFRPILELERFDEFEFQSVEVFLPSRADTRIPRNKSKLTENYTPSVVGHLLRFLLVVAQLIYFILL